LRPCISRAPGIRAALDVGKAELVRLVRIPAEGNPKKRLQEVSTHSAMSRSLAELANHLVDLRIERLVMEATSDYWKPVFSTFWRRTGSSRGWSPWSRKQARPRV
jgi:hypothetical protein